MTATDLPPDVYYFAKLTHDDRSGTVWVVSILTLTYCLVSACVRFVLRRGMYGLDDLALCISVSACVVQHAFIYLAVVRGLGKAQQTTTMVNLSEFNQVTYVRLVLAMVVHCLAKVSLTLFIRRLFYGQARINRIICNVLLAANVSYGVLAVMSLLIRCKATWYFGQRNACPHLLTRFAIFKSVDVVTELALVFVPIFLLSRQLLARKHRMIVIGTFAARLPVIFFTLTHYFALRESTHEHGDRALRLVRPVLWLQVTIMWSMVTASLPSFKPLVSPFTKVSRDTEAQQIPGPAPNGAGFFMGSQKSQQQAATLSTWQSLGAPHSHLEELASSSNWRADRKTTSEITIEGPRRNVLGLRKKGSEDVEMGTIQYDTFFEIKYETAS